MVFFLGLFLLFIPSPWSGLCLPSCCASSCHSWAALSQLAGCVPCVWDSAALPPTHSWWPWHSACHLLFCVLRALKDSVTCSVLPSAVTLRVRAREYLGRGSGRGWGGQECRIIIIILLETLPLRSLRSVVWPLLSSQRRGHMRLPLLAPARLGCLQCNSQGTCLGSACGMGG